LRNVMGLWLVQECRRVWRKQGSDRGYDELQALAGRAPADVAVFDPDHDSLACKYRMVCEQLEHVCERAIDTIHVVGGGARNELLCQLTADVCGREVVTGPVEATALGNLLVQAMALGELDGLDDVRRVVARSVAPRRFTPQPSASGNEVYPRFLEATGLSAMRAVRAPV